jgi:L-histidine Nalpha-methyltransferase
LSKLANHMRVGDHLLLGTDLVKDHAVLNAAYNDRAGITAAFNKNVLRVINHRLDAHFDLEAFEHVAYFDPHELQIEMHLESRRAQSVRIGALHIDVGFDAGERILTEISRKFSRDSVAHMLSDAGLALDAWFEPANAYFGLSVARRS